MTRVQPDFATKLLPIILEDPSAELQSDAVPRVTDKLLFTLSVGEMDLGQMILSTPSMARPALYIRRVGKLGKRGKS